MIDGKVAPFDDEDGVWLRCALHTHTTESDGWLSPTMLRRYHALAGFDVLAITDHDRHTIDPDGDDELILLGGVEVSLTAPASGGPLHLLGIGIDRMPEVDRASSLADAALAVRAAGGLPFVAHPIWSGLRTDEVAGIEHCAGIEVYNSSCDVEQDRAHAGAHWDIWLAMGHRLTGIATDDLHYPGYEAFRGWTIVHARERSRQAVLDALAAGRFYATTGPRIQAMSWRDGVLTVACSPARSVAALANPPYGARVNAGHHALTYRGSRVRTEDGQALEGIVEGDLLSGALFRGYPAVRYARITVQDDHGRRAWTNPTWFDET